MAGYNFHNHEMHESVNAPQAEGYYGNGVMNHNDLQDDDVDGPVTIPNPFILFRGDSGRGKPGADQPNVSKRSGVAWKDDASIRRKYQAIHKRYKQHPEEYVAWQELKVQNGYKPARKRGKGKGKGKPTHVEEAAASGVSKGRGKWSRNRKNEETLPPCPSFEATGSARILAAPPLSYSHSLPPLTCLDFCSRDISTDSSDVRLGLSPGVALPPMVSGSSTMVSYQSLPSTSAVYHASPHMMPVSQDTSSFPATTGWNSNDQYAPLNLPASQAAGESSSSSPPIQGGYVLPQASYGLQNWQHSLIPDASSESGSYAATGSDSGSEFSLPPTPGLAYLVGQWHPFEGPACDSSVPQQQGVLYPIFHEAMDFTDEAREPAQWPPVISNDSVAVVYEYSSYYHPAW